MDCVKHRLYVIMIEGMAFVSSWTRVCRCASVKVSDAFIECAVAFVSLFIL